MAVIDFGTADGSTLGNPSTGRFFTFIDSNNSNAYTLRDDSGSDTILGQSNPTGWVSISDTTYTEGAPFSLPSNTDTALRFNIDSHIDNFAPNGYDYTDFFNDVDWRVLSPDIGANYNFRLTFTCKPSANSKQLVTSYSIGTGVGSQIIIDQRTSELRYSGTGGYISMTSLIYSLDTFIANGMQIILNANTNCDIYDITMVISKN